MQRAMDVWEQIKERLSNRLPWESFQSWFARTTYLRVKDERLYVAVPNQDTGEWIEKEFGDHVRAVMRDLRLPCREVSFEAVSTADSASAAPEPVFNGDNLFAPSTAQLNQRYTFSSFVVGACNQF